MQWNADHLKIEYKQIRIEAVEEVSFQRIIKTVSREYEVIYLRFINVNK